MKFHSQPTQSKAQGCSSIDAIENDTVYLMSISKTINEADKNLNAPRLDGPEIGDLCDSQQAYFNLIYCVQLQPADGLQATYLALETMSQWIPVIRNTLSCCFHQRP